uniref:Subtilisin n=1 Tax=Lotharella globosa TaxID=91324 RepID=A0A7S3Z8W6_9EUKA|mmetsp:Transcript_28255/g.55020  ORF Transcript_28255/g.55020 Transcript_28255/m.55020 type:complete len:119 (+) Transcript_28255:68-424(+)
MHSRYSNKVDNGPFSFLHILLVAVVVGLLYVAFRERAPPIPRRVVAIPGKEHWPELVGIDSEKAVQIIKAERPDLTDVHTVPTGSFVTMDYRMDRVRVFVDDPGGTGSGMVKMAPHVG